MRRWKRCSDKMLIFFANIEYCTASGYVQPSVSGGDPGSAFIPWAAALQLERDDSLMAITGKEIWSSCGQAQLNMPSTMCSVYHTQHTLPLTNLH